MTFSCYKSIRVLALCPQVVVTKVILSITTCPHNYITAINITATGGPLRYISPLDITGGPLRGMSSLNIKVGPLRDNSIQNVTVCPQSFLCTHIESLPSRSKAVSFVHNCGALHSAAKHETLCGNRWLQVRDWDNHIPRHMLLLSC